MLTEIHIRDLATIESLHLQLHTGCTMITGETGAGKSVFLEAIELALGRRANTNMIRPGKEKAEISLTFDITHFPAVIQRLTDLDLYMESNECIIRRIMCHDGRSRCYVNGSPATLQFLKELSELLFHLHGQYEQHFLLQTDHQREMLDRFALQLPQTVEIKSLAEQYKNIDQAIVALQDKTQERIQRSAFIRFQLDELETLHLHPGEWERLEAEHQRLAHADTSLQHIHQALSQLIGSDNNEQTIHALLSGLRKTLEMIRTTEPKANEWLDNLQATMLSLEDLRFELQHYADHVASDPEKLQTLETRITHIFNLARKHKVQPAELHHFHTQLQAELQTLTTSDETIQALKEQQIAIASRYEKQAAQLSQTRIKAAQQFSKDITATMQSLSLPHGEFKVELEKETHPYALHGNEKIIFLIKTNPDQTLQPLSKVISGGELSRLSLAAHLALANKTRIPTLIFDEVDTGLSGATAEKIGKLLRKLGDSYQVFCVTHQPQVAAYGHHHVLVEKYFIEQSTHTRLRLITAEEKTHEIARMMSGEKITKSTLAYAKEVLQNQ